ncbi:MULTISPECIES: hypothetical protein [Paenibacillus]|uniref:Nucleoside diphosphate kinase-like domain-containing protein n=1 Tax=Paenibacillus borealis TaxID=160799 RepID=A0ABX3GSV1_PAEBO|nr:hypothetical protein [Paenibacillus borealis]OMD36390.1 hypothetical protein BSK56_32225 [Paenibacillus borealis]
MLINNITRVPGKEELLLRDPFFREGKYQFHSYFRNDAEKILSQLALVIIRPDAFLLGKAKNAVKLIESMGYEPLSFQLVTIDRVILREFWRLSFSQATIDRILILERLFSLFTSVAIVFRNKNSSIDWPASVNLSIKKGSAKTEKRSSIDIRSMLESPNRFLSLLHVSDEPGDLLREMCVLFSSTESLKFFVTIQGHINNKSTCHNQLMDKFEYLESIASKQNGIFNSRIQRYCLNHEEFFKDYKIEKSLFERKDLTLNNLDTIINELDLSPFVDKFISVILAGQYIQAYDPSAPSKSIDSFKLFWTESTF